jgi:hypothetical protein
MRANRDDTMAMLDTRSRPIMADQLKALLAMPCCNDDVERIVDQPIDAVIVEVFRIGPGTDRIAAPVDPR